MDTIKAIKLSALLQAATINMVHLDNKLFLLNSIPHPDWDEGLQAQAILDCSREYAKAKAHHARLLSELESIPEGVCNA